MNKDYFQLNVHQKINTKFYANLYKTGYASDNESLIIFIISQFDLISFTTYSAIPLKNGEQLINDKRRFIL